MNSPSSVRVIGVDSLAQRELETTLDQGTVKFEKIEVPGGTYGEPGTIIAVVVISVAAIKGLTAWLMKRRRHGTVEQTIEIEYADGRKVRKNVRFDVSSSDPQKVLDQVGAAFEIDPKLFAQAAG